MTKFIAVALSLAFVAVVGTAALRLPSAEAGGTGKYVGTLNAYDAGASNTVCFRSGSTPIPNQTARLNCEIPACYRTGTQMDGGFLAVNCSTDDVVLVGNATVAIGAVPTFYVPPFEVQMGGDPCIAARAFDGGNPSCEVEQVFFNPAGR